MRTSGLIAIALLFVAVIFLSLIAVALMQDHEVVPTTGIVGSANIAIFSDSLLTIPKTSHSFGTISPGKSATMTVWIKNTGSLPVKLTYFLSDYLPAGIENNMTSSTDYLGSVIQPGDSLQYNFILSINADATGASFSFNIHITGTEPTT